MGAVDRLAGIDPGFRLALDRALSYAGRLALTRVGFSRQMATR